MRITKVNMLDRWMNKVVHGDCLQLMKELPDGCIDLIVTDPPYGINYQSNMRSSKFDVIEGDDSLDNVIESLGEIYRIMKNNSHMYCFMAWQNMGVLYDGLKHIGFKIKNCLIIPKRHGSAGDLKSYSQGYEMCLFIVKGKRSLNHLKRDKASTRSLRDVRYKGNGYRNRYKAILDFLVAEEFNLDLVHPTQKSLKTMGFFYRNII